MDFSISLDPEIYNEELRVLFTIDPFHIKQITTLDFTDYHSYIYYLTGFIKSLSYYNQDESVSVEIGADTIIPGDPFGISSPITGSFALGENHLGFTHQFRYNGYSHNISFSDIRLQSEKLQADIILDYESSRRFSIGTALHIELENSDAVYYPEFYIRRPFVSTENISFGLQFTGAFEIKDSNVKGYGLSFALPYVTENLLWTNGIALTKGDLQYGASLNGYDSQRDNENTLLLFSKITYDLRNFDIVADLQLPLSLSPFGIAHGEDYASLEIRADLDSIFFASGFRLMGLITEPVKGIKEKSEVFLSLGYSNKAISTEMSLLFTEKFKPELELKASMNMKEALSASSPDVRRRNSFVSFELYTGYHHTNASKLFIKPVLSFGSQKNVIGFRLPITIQTRNDQLVILPDGRDEWFTFGFGSETTAELVYKAITDVFFLVEELTFGTDENSLYLLAERGVVRDSNLFNAFGSYGSQDNLSLSAGVDIKDKGNIYLFVDNLGSPAITSLDIEVKPMGEQGPLIGLTSAMDFRIHRNGNLDFILPLELSMDLSLLDKKLNISLFANTFLEKEGKEFLSHLFSYESAEFTAGVDFFYEVGSYKIRLEAGAIKGRARRIYFDPFTYRSRTIVENNYSFAKPVPFIGINLSFEEENHGYNIGYTKEDLFSTSSDMLRLGARYTFNGLSLEGAYIQKQFIKGIIELAKGGDIRSFLVNDNTIIYLAISKSFEHLSISGSLLTTPDFEVDEEYINVLHPGKVDIAFTVSASLRF